MLQYNILFHLATNTGAPKTMWCGMAPVFTFAPDRVSFQEYFKPLNAFCPQNAFCYPQIYFYHLIFSWWLNRIIIRFWQCYNDCVTTLRNSGNSIDLDEQAPGLLMSSSIIPTFPTSYVWSHLLVGGYLWSSAIVGSIPKASINVVKFDNLEQLDRLYILSDFYKSKENDKAWKVYTAQLLAKKSNYGFGFVTEKWET